MYGCVNRLKVFENRVLRRIFVHGSGENFIMRSFMICAPHSIWCD
jgi:hypothetical protein